MKRVENSTDLPVIASRLREARMRAGISQKTLGILAGIDEFSASARVNQYERGKHVPDFATLEKFADLLLVPAAYFYAEDDALADLIAMFGNMKSAERKKLLVFADSLRSLPGG